MGDTEVPATSHRPAETVVLLVCLLLALPASAAEIIDGTGAGDTIDVSTSNVAHEIHSLSGYDTVFGSQANDLIDGGAGKDQIYGNDGDDLLIGGRQPDEIHGGKGDDVIAVYGSREGCDSIYGDDGIDTLQGSSDDDYICVDKLVSVERIDAGAGNDILAIANGSDGRLDLSESQLSGVELVLGSLANDEITGTSGADVIAGDQGNDVIDGGPGKDTAKFSGPLQSYLISIENQALVVEDVVGRDRTDTLRNIEQLEFADQTVAAAEYLPPNPDNAPPIAEDDYATVDEDLAVDIEVAANDRDPDGDPLYIAEASGASHGTVTIIAAGTLRYQPERNFFGFDTFIYRSDDGRGGSDSAQVVVEVIAVPDSPIARADAADTSMDQSVDIDVLSNDSDADGDNTLEIVALGAAARGSVTLIAEGTVRYQPEESFTGQDSFTYEVSDSTGLLATATVTVRVTGTQPPVNGSALLEAVQAAPEGSWLRVNENRFSDVWPDSTQIPYTPGYLQPAKVIFAWGSMAWDPNRDQLIFWGGGHANYSGNEVYRFDTVSLRWERASLPSDAVNLLGDQQYFAVDGPFNAPTSAHTYDNQIFLPLADRFLTFGGAKFNGKQQWVLEDGETLTGPYLWDPSKAGADMVGGTTGSQVNRALYPEVIGAGMWENRDTVVSSGQGVDRPSGDFVNSTTAYHTVAGKDAVFVTDSPRRGGELYRYIVGNTAAQDRWEIIGRDSTGYGNQGAGAYDAGRQIYVRTANTSAGWALVVWDTSSPGPDNRSFLATPTDPDGEFSISELHGMDFDQKRGVFVLWDGGPDIWYVTPPSNIRTGNWTAKRAPTGDPALGPRQMDAGLITYQGKLKGQRGVLGKWEYAADLDLFFGVVAPESGDVWVYKPAGWTPPE